ncbi:hypothetical protein FA09DRAFT_102453 [Tilletiopsis washingtonensis]|uniref:Chromo domain-containing protein n=1 Tax=Tilletiopsis washingtonensis TaxID=58919 RepID=A0A316Z749_9BASI|nr:hypothetical protein FA09DRAFT_102453 [Tilletiopsis washingtonensis]PWN95993.1 hypothetical protein FA09DRAFT_102453 [Tilletiopsis washingtonensis]
MCHDSDSSEGFEVEAIYGYSRTRKEVAVKWKGYGLKKDEWQPLPHVEMGCGELLLRFKKLAGIEPDVELEDTESIAPDHRGWQKYRLSDDEDEDEPDDEPRRGEEDDDSADAYEAEASDDSDPESAQVGRKRKRKAPPSPTKRKPGPKIHRVKDPVSLQEDRRARAARATKSKPVNDYTIGIPKPPKETRGRDDPLGPHDDAYILGTIFNWFCSIGPVGDLNRFAYLQKIAGLPGPTEKRKAGELVRTGIQATMHRLVDHALQRGSLKPPTGVKRVTNQQTADMIAAIYELWQGRVPGCSHSPEWISMANARNLSLDRSKEGAKVGNERLRQRATHLFSKIKTELRKCG